MIRDQALREIDIDRIKNDQTFSLFLYSYLPANPKNSISSFATQSFMMARYWDKERTLIDEQRLFRFSLMKFNLRDLNGLATNIAWRLYFKMVGCAEV